MTVKTPRRSYKSPFSTKTPLTQSIVEKIEASEEVNKKIKVNSETLAILKKELKKRLKQLQTQAEKKEGDEVEESEEEKKSEVEIEKEEDVDKKIDDALYKAKIDQIVLTKETLEKFPYRQGPLNAKIVFVGEAPGEQEKADEFSRPFIGSSGQELRKMLRQVGINPDEVYFTNLLKEHPPDNDFEDFVEKHPLKFAFFCKILAAELQLLSNATVIVPVGAQALKIICGKRSIENWRGSIIPATIAGSVGRKCVPIIHPAAILRQWLYRPATIVDLKRIKEEAEFKEIILPQRKYIIRPDFVTVLQKIKEYKESKALLSVDTETIAGRLVSIQLCISPDEAIAILFQHKNGDSYWPLDQEIIIWVALADLLENCGKRIIGQNFLTYDIFVLAVQGFKWEKILANVFLDTMEASQCLQAQLPKGLDFLTSIYTKEPFYKSEGKEWETKQGEEEFLTYGCKDVVVVDEIAPQLRQELIEEGLLDFYYARYQGMAHERLKASLEGIKIDLNKREELQKQFMKDIIENQCRITILANENINVRSFPQMSKLLYTTMKLPKQWKDGKITTNEDAILALSAKNPSEIFSLLIKSRHLRTLNSNNLQSKLDSDGHFRSSFGFTITGRFTSYSCPLYTGGNLQNWTPDMRVMLVPDSPDLCFVEGDLSQADARVVFWRARDENMIEAFLSGEDIHVRNACLIFDLSKDKVTKEIRYTAKRIVHACNYDMQAPRFAQVYNKDAAEQGFPLINIATAGAFIGKYHEAVPSLRSVYHKEIQELLSTTKILTNPFGRRIIFHDRIGHDLFKQGYAWYAQSTVADLINIIYERVARLNLHVKLQIHDALLIQCKPEERNDVARILKEVSQIPILIEGRELIIPMEIKAGDPGVSWKDLKKVA